MQKYKKHVLKCLEKIERNLLTAHWSVNHESNQIKKEDYEEIISR